MDIPFYIISALGSVLRDIGCWAIESTPFPASPLTFTFLFDIYQVVCCIAACIEKLEALIMDTYKRRPG